MRHRILAFVIMLVWLTTSTCNASITQTPTSFPTPTPLIPTTGLSICSGVPHPAMLFQLDSDKAKYVLHHPASGTECILQFDPFVSQILALTASGVYYTTVITGQDGPTEQVLHHANDGTLSYFPTSM